MAAAPSERLTRRAADGKVYFRLAKRKNTTDETWTTAGATFYHWCANESPEVLTPDTPAHVCDIWGVADDQIPADEPEAAPIAERELTTAELIRRVLFTEEQLSAEPVPLLARAAVLALLKQAKALEDIIVLLQDWRQSLESPQPKKTYTELPDEQG